ncbi:MAG: amidohydrolase family protein [Desulfobacteraceae bacterium]
MDIKASVIDAHAHCGVLDRLPDQSFTAYHSCVRRSEIGAVVMFSPVMEIYDRYEPHFKDSPEWRQRRQRSNQYLLTIGARDLRVIPYFFIWNDFAVDQLTGQHCGIKWHRHADEPVYHYEEKKCQKAIDLIRRRNLPVVLEEELSNTIGFINDIAPGVPVIIPHLGGLNGGYRAIAENRLWEKRDVYTDTALAPEREIRAYIETYGHDRILFGSDFPFGDPVEELSKIKGLGLSKAAEKALLGGNLKALLAGVKEKIQDR